MCELEEGALMPTTDSADIKMKKVYFWYKDIQDAVLHHFCLDIKEYSSDYFLQFGSIDIVVEGDHGQSRLWMMMWLMYCNKCNSTVPVVMHTIKIGHIDCSKDTREVLEKTIMKPIIEGLQKILVKLQLFLELIIQFLLSKNHL